MFVQPNSEQKCLLGMNAIPFLGISVLRANGEPLISACEPSTPQVANVCLVQSTTIPSQKGRFVKAHVDCDPSQGDHLLFEPRHSTLESLGLNTQESLLTVHSDGMVLIPVENFQGIPVILEKGAQLGVAKRYEPDVVVINENVLNEGNCAAVTATPDNSSECYEQLLKVLSLSESDVDPAQMAQLKKLLADNTDVFALNDAELGCTDLVQHVIETGSHPPIKQQPYRTPFTQHEKIGQMIDDM